ncbi:unnamed protein product [Phaedon cochleariae]|uniref:Uncharacterized protein n=1 Tax=Phaedon cochleariae TaxID=80249 RepID=A0A9N9SF51_PHACE|nr:unnamed protein product [Phaedon cochleariae]
MSIGWNFQMQYDVPTNITMLQQYPPFYDRKFREKRTTEETDRSLFYKAFEDVLNGAGIDGRDCILRSICENAAESLHHEANGLYGLIFHIVFTPNYGNEAGDSNMDPSYMEAQRAGEYGVECHTLYSKCTLDDGLIGLFSILDYELG